MRAPSMVLRVGLRAMRPIVTSNRLSMNSKRRLVDVIAGASKVPSWVTVKVDSLAGIPIQRVMPRSAQPDVAVLFFHGGGYASGTATGYRGFGGALADAAGAEVILVDYRLAPEHPYPAALDDAFSVYRELRQQVPTIAVAGDSAGGGLTLALAQRIRDNTLPAPAALGLICPWLDLAADQSGTRTAGRDPLIIPPLIAEWCAFYAGEHDASDPGISPIHGDLTSLPPIVMHSAGDDPLAVDADKLEYAMAAQSSGVLIHRRFTKLWHDFHLQAGFLADADRAVELFGGQLAELIAATRR